VEVAEMMMMLVVGSLTAAVHQNQTPKRLVVSLNCQCCQVYYPAQFQKQQLQYTNITHALIFM
jgi:hypothetical protein